MIDIVNERTKNTSRTLIASINTNQVEKILDIEATCCLHASFQVLLEKEKQQLGPVCGYFRVSALLFFCQTDAY